MISKERAIAILNSHWIRDVLPVQGTTDVWQFALLDPEAKKKEPFTGLTADVVEQVSRMDVEVIALCEDRGQKVLTLKLSENKAPGVSEVDQ